MQNIRKVKLYSGDTVTLAANFDTYLCYKSAFGMCIEDGKIELQRFNVKTGLLATNFAKIKNPTVKDIDAYYDAIKSLQGSYSGISDRRLCIAMILAAGDTRTVADIERDIALELNDSGSELFKALIELMPLLTPELKKNE